MMSITRSTNPMSQKIGASSAVQRAIALVRSNKKLAPNKKDKTLLGGKPEEIIIRPVVDEQVVNGKGQHIAIVWGRMNPPTVGHQKVVDTLVAYAKKTNAVPQIYLTRTTNSKKDPLDYNTKITIAKKSFGSKLVAKMPENVRTLIELLKHLNNKYSDISIIVGSDRVAEFKQLLNKYNNKEYNYNQIMVVSAGQRDPDDSSNAVQSGNKLPSVSAVSASLLRKYAIDGKYDLFVAGLPPKVRKDGKAIYDRVIAGLQVKEGEEEMDDNASLLERVLTVAQRRKKGLQLRRIRAKIIMGQKRARRRRATPERLLKRARKAAINRLRARFAGQRGAQYATLSPAEKVAIDRRIEGKQKMIEKIARRLLPRVRRREKERFERMSKGAESKSAPKLTSISPSKIIEVAPAAQTSADHTKSTRERHQRERENLRAKQTREMQSAMSRDVAHKEVKIEDFDPDMMAAMVTDVENGISEADFVEKYSDVVRESSTPLHRSKMWRKPKMKSSSLGGDTIQDPEIRKKAVERSKEIARAHGQRMVAKDKEIFGDRPGTGAWRLKREGAADQIDELSKDTLLSYREKAEKNREYYKHKANVAKRSIGRALKVKDDDAAEARRAKHHALYSKAMDKIATRSDGISTASSKILHKNKPNLFPYNRPSGKDRYKSKVEALTYNKNRDRLIDKMRKHAGTSGPYKKSGEIDDAPVTKKDDVKNTNVAESSTPQLTKPGNLTVSKEWPEVAYGKMANMIRGGEAVYGIYTRGEEPKLIGYMWKAKQISAVMGGRLQIGSTTKKGWYSSLQSTSRSIQYSPTDRETAIYHVIMATKKK